MTTIIEFGSRRHGCHDIYSDKDAYILYEVNDDVFKEKSNLELKGYSVTTSSITRAKYLSYNGSLFVRHVFFEGRVIKGSEEQKNDIQNIWRPALGYENEIEENIYMLSLLETLPCTMESALSVNDIVICSLRNILIRKLAGYGDFVFSWKDVISKSIRYGFIDLNDALLMRFARKYKNCYRFGFMPRLNALFLADLEKLTQKVIDKRRKFKVGAHKNILELPERFNEGSYTQLRAIELLCSHYHFNQSMERYIALFKDPSYFTALGPNKALQRINRSPKI